MWLPPSLLPFKYSKGIDGRHFSRGFSPRPALRLSFLPLALAVSLIHFLVARPAAAVDQEHARKVLISEAGVRIYQREFNLNAQILGNLKPPRRHDLPKTNTGDRRSRHLFKWVIPAGDRLGDVEIWINSPAPQLDQALPTILVMAGVDTGEKAAQLVGDPGQNYVVSLRWPLPAYPDPAIPLPGTEGDPGHDKNSGGVQQDDLPPLLQVAESLTRPEVAQYQKELLAGLQIVPGHIATTLAALRGQDWVAEGRLAVMGVSFGSIVLPLGVHLADHLRPPRGTESYIQAYGGADLALFFEVELAKVMNTSQMGDLVQALRTLASPIDPCTHLAMLKGKFYNVHGTEDERMPKTSVKMLDSCTPWPRDASGNKISNIKFIAGGHIGRERPELIEKLNELVFRWLIAESGFNP